MEGSSKLVPSHIKAWCDSSIEALEEDNKCLWDSLLCIEGFVMDETLDDKCFKIINEQMSTLYSAINDFRTANDLDIQDFKTLRSIVGDEELDDNKLLVALELAKLELEKSKVLASKYKNVVKELPIEYALNSNSNEIEYAYDELVCINANILENIQAKLEIYNEINIKASKLFINGEYVRQKGIIKINEMMQVNYSNVSDGTLNNSALSYLSGIIDLDTSLYSYTSSFITE